MVHYHYQPIEDSAVVNPHISTQSQPLKLLINEEKAQIQIQINLNLNTPCNSFVPPRKDPLPTLGNRRMLDLRILIRGIVEIVIWLGGAKSSHPYIYNILYKDKVCYPFYIFHFYK